MSLALGLLSRDPRIGKIFLAPHLAAKFGAGTSKIRFQGCAAARHDDHIHIQLRRPFAACAQLSVLASDFSRWLRTTMARHSPTIRQSASSTQSKA